MKESAADGAHRVSRRIHAVLLNHDEHTSSEISALLDVSRSKVSEWLKIFDEQGVDGLLEGERSGRPCLMSDLQKILLCDIIDSGPIAYGLVSGIWTAKIIAGVIQDEFGINYHVSHVCRLLHEFGFSVQSPKRVLARADAEKRAKWTSKTYPTIKKKPSVKTHVSSLRTKPVSDRTQHYIERGLASPVNL